jgi:hypothetical protein
MRIMDNYRWDVVYACSGAYINAQLAAKASDLIQTFTYEDTAVQVQGQFGTWQIVPGGGGTLLQFETPVAAGTVVIKSTGESIALDGAIPLVQLQLQLHKGSTQDVVSNLVFNCTTAGQGPGDTTPGAVTVIDVDTSGTLAGHPSGALAAALLRNALCQIFLQNANQLNFVFAGLLPTPVGENADWLTPVSSAYCYQQPVDTTALGGIAILGALTNADVSGYPANFDSTLLAGEDFGFVLSAQAFMQNVILPALPASFQGNCNAGDLTLNADGSITMGQGFNLNDVTVGAIDYTPSVTSLRYAINDTAMDCYVATSTDITGLVDASVSNSVTSSNQSTFDVQTRLLSFADDPNKSTTEDTHIPWWESVLGALTLGIMNVVIEAVSLAIENSAGDVTSSATAQSLGSVAPGLVSWTGQQSVVINAGGLADNIYMQGSIQPT